MTEAQFNIRPASAGDAPALARLEQLLSDGYAELIWEMFRHRYPGKSLIEIGEARFGQDEGVTSYRNCWVAEYGSGGQTAGMMFAFGDVDQTEETEKLSDPHIEPLFFTEDEGAFHISSIGVFGAYQNQGIGSAFIDLAKETARQQNLDRVSLVVFDRNVRARALYERHGFKEAARNALVPHPKLRVTGDAVLMIAPA